MPLPAASAARPPSASERSLLDQRRNERLQCPVGVGRSLAAALAPVDPDLQEVAVVAGQQELAEQPVALGERRIDDAAEGDRAIPAVRWHRRPLEVGEA